MYQRLYLFCPNRGAELFAHVLTPTQHRLLATKNTAIIVSNVRKNPLIKSFKNIILHILLIIISICKDII